MLLADVCGAAASFAELAAELRDLMKRNVNVIQQTRIVRAMSQRLSGASEQGVFASTLVGTYFASTRTLTLCNAGHPPPLVYRAKADRWEVLKQTPTHISAGELADSAPLGVVDQGEYHHWKSPLKQGDMVLSYSNALTECRGEDGRTLGVNGMLDIVQSLASDQPEQLTSRLANSVRAADPRNLASDDASILLCRATDTPVPWRDTLLAPLRLLRSVSDKTELS